MVDQIDKEKIDRNKANKTLLIIVLTIIGIVFMMNQCSKPSNNNLPPHSMVDSHSLAPKNGRRIQLNSSNPALSRNDCIAIINKYRSDAGPEGQVGVHKPSPKMGGNMTPWCVDNMDGKGVFFNDHLF